MQCPQGHPVESGQRFCSECGALVTHQAVKTTDTARRPKLEPRFLLAAVAAIGLVVILVAVFLRVDSGNASLDGKMMLSGLAYQDVTFDVDRPSLNPDEIVEGIPRGSGCSGIGGFDDIEEGQTIRVLDQDGTLLGTGTLGGGKVEALVADEYLVGASCSFDFEITALPGADFYQIQVGRRTGAEYSRKELEDSDWEISLSLGR